MEKMSRFLSVVPTIPNSNVNSLENPPSKRRHTTNYPRYRRFRGYRRFHPRPTETRPTENNQSTTFEETSDEVLGISLFFLTFRGSNHFRQSKQHQMKSKIQQKNPKKKSPHKQMKMAQKRILFPLKTIRKVTMFKRSTISRLLKRWTQQPLSIIHQHC